MIISFLSSSYWSHLLLFLKCIGIFKLPRSGGLFLKVFDTDISPEIVAKLPEQYFFERSAF